MHKLIGAHQMGKFEPELGLGVHYANPVRGSASYSATSLTGR